MTDIDDDTDSTARGPWATRCPDGHASIEHRQDVYYCDSCDRHYKSDPYDARTTEFPVAETGEVRGIDDRALLADLAAMCSRPTRTLAKAFHLDRGMTDERVGALRRLVDQGLVERVPRSASCRDWYRPTPAGWRAVGREVDGQEVEV